LDEHLTITGRVKTQTGGAPSHTSSDNTYF